MEYDYEFMWDYEISVHDDLDENVYTYAELDENYACLLYTSPSPRDRTRSRMPSSA